MAHAAEHGESLKDLVNRAIADEVGLPATPKGKTGRVTLPLIARDAKATILVTNDDIEDTFGAEDVERLAPSQARRRWRASVRRSTRTTRSRPTSSAKKRTTSF